MYQNKLNILYHHRTQAKKAEGVHIREIVQALKKLGNNVHIISPPGIDIFKDEKENYNKVTDKKTVSWGIVSKNMPQIGFELMEIMYNFLASLNFRKLFKKENIDFIYERYAFFCWIGTFYAKKRKIPIILEVNEVSGIKRTRGQVLKRLANWIEKKVFQNADVIIVVSEFLKNHIKNMEIDAHKIQVVSNGVNENKFNPDIVKSDDLRENLNLKGKTVLGFVGNFVKWHNFDFLIQCYKDILDMEDKKELSLMLVGDGPMKNELMKLVVEQGLGSNIVFTGSVSYEKIPEYISIMDICIIPHSNKFRSPIKMFEYMAMGKPIVAPAVEPIERIVNDGITGVMFSLGDEGLFKNCMLDLIRNKEKRKRIGDEARKAVLTNHLWKYNAETIVRAYNNTKKSVG